MDTGTIGDGLILIDRHLTTSFDVYGTDRMLCGSIGNSWLITRLDTNRYRDNWNFPRQTFSHYFDVYVKGRKMCGSS